MNRLVCLVAVVLPLAAAAQDRPLPPQDAPKRMTLPEGFQATLFAGEPDVVQPIAMTFDDRGRLWVVECMSYPKWTDKPEGGDRVLMFEDTDGDGKFDKRTVVFDKGANLSGIELGFGGIWLCSLPNLLFIPCDFNADAPKLGKPQVLLDGWSLDCKHNVFSSLTWGPDGWLYGCNGIIATSKVGKPGTPDKDRVPMNCGVWRYHPTRQVFEVFAQGTTNPFGLDFDDSGECFITNCVIGHLWHVIPGAHFERMYGEDLNPYVYQLMPTCADHLHWGGGDWTNSRGGKGIHSEAGGGHAHVGCMVYLGDNWPDKYRNGVFMLNLHGSRINHDRLEHKGSGYVAKHEPDFMLANDPWFRGIAVKYGPDGGVLVSDWTDTGECHNYKEIDRTNGRIYKITFGRPKLWQGDVSKLSDAELVKLQLHKNDWQVRHSRRVLQERAAGGTMKASTPKELKLLFTDEKDQLRRLRALWALNAVGAFPKDKLVMSLLYESNANEADVPPVLQAWAWRLFFDRAHSPDPNRDVANQHITFSKNPSVQLAFIAAVQQLDMEERSDWIWRFWHVTPDMANDPNIPLMMWYAVEPIVENDPKEALRVVGDIQIPLVRQFTARRLTGIVRNDVNGLDLLLADMIDNKQNADVKIVDRRRDYLRGIVAALNDRRDMEKPAMWPVFYAMMAPKLELQADVRRLAVLFGDLDALKTVRAIVMDQSQPAQDREAALALLVRKQRPDLQQLLVDLLADQSLRSAAIRGLAAFKNDETPKHLLTIYPKLSETEKADVVQTLASRPAWALSLLDAIENKQLPRTDVSVFVARQIQGLKDKQVQERLAKVWGQIKPASKEKAEQMAKFKQLLTAEFLKTADLSKGRLVFSKNCAVCHRLYDDGAAIGPALTGSQRANLDYVLENVLDPSAVVPKEYQMSKIETTNGRTVNGIIKQETDKALTIQTPNEVIVLPKDEIESRAQSPLSLMPEGIFDKLSKEEIRDLVAYLAGKDQAPLPK